MVREVENISHQLNLALHPLKSEVPSPSLPPSLPVVTLLNGLELPSFLASSL